MTDMAVSAQPTTVVQRSRSRLEALNLRKSYGSRQVVKDGALTTVPEAKVRDQVAELTKDWS